MRPVETQPNCQSTPPLADVRPTTSMTSFLKLWVPVELHQMQREGWGPLDKEEIRWREEKEARSGIKIGAANVCVHLCVCVTCEWVLRHAKVSEPCLCLHTPQPTVMHLTHISESSVWFMCANKGKKNKWIKLWPLPLFIQDCLQKPGLRFSSWGLGGICLSAARAKKGEGRKVSQDAHWHDCVSVPSGPGADPRCYGLCQRIVLGHDRHAIYMAVCN